MELSIEQTSTWFAHQALVRTSPAAFNSSISCRISGPLPVERLIRAISLIAKRHDVFRTRFFCSDDGAPSMEVASKPILRLGEKLIFSEEEAAQEAQGLQQRPYHLASGGIRLQLLTLSETLHFLQVGYHQIALDRAGAAALFKELEEATSDEGLNPVVSYCQSDSSLQRLPHGSVDMSQNISYFRDLLKDNGSPVQLLPFTTAGQRRPLQEFRLHRATMSLQRATAARIEDFVQSSPGCTKLHVHLAVLQLMLFNVLPETESLVIGVRDPSRDQGLAGAMGSLANWLPVRFDRADLEASNNPQSAAIKMVRDSLGGAVSHSVPFYALVDALGIAPSLEHHPVFQVQMDYRHTEIKPAFAECNSQIEMIPSSSSCDMVLEITGGAEQQLITVGLQASLYDQNHADLFLRAYHHNLEYFLGHPDESLLNSPIWPHQDIQHALEVGRGPRMELQWAPTLAHRVDGIVSTPNCRSRVALKDGHGHALTYSEMGDRVNTIATQLAAQGITDVENPVVAVFQEPSADWICSMLAILRVGGAYVPLDLKNGVDRLARSVSIAQPCAILVDTLRGQGQETIQALQASCGSHPVVINVSDIETTPDCAQVPITATPSTAAVILFTSGSTGRPKGITLPHSCLSAHAEGVERVWSVGGSEQQQMRPPLVVLQQIALSFDFSLHQIFTALANGGTLVIVPSAARGDAYEITQMMLHEGVTHTLATPTEYAMWFAAGSDLLADCARSSWRWALTGGEALPKSILRDFAALGSPEWPRLYDFYGPIEATIAITKGEVPYRDPANLKMGQALSAGHVLPNYSVHILDEKRGLQPVPVGVSGEIVVGGPGLANGYLGLPELTAEKFIPTPFHDEYAEARGWTRLYRTGDRGRLNEAGELFYEGRIDGDTQVKVMGVRTELGDIESAILASPGARGTVKQAVVAVHGTGLDQILAAYIVLSRPGGGPDETSKLLRDLHAGLPLPQHLRPSVFVPVAEIPTNVHGKTDRKALLRDVPLPGRSDDRHGEDAIRKPPALRCQTEKRLAALWLAVLPPSDGRQLDREANFFQRGGRSQGLVQLLRLVKYEFNLCSVLQFCDVVGCTTLREMAEMVDAAKSMPSPTTTLPARPSNAVVDPVSV
ncbi:polyketide synthase PksB [Apiospora saccharicola]|uniref:Polyketide synthase PksB n=1 Tax=Apiospora saccharicola TaxID=335842 RepID=A0ABR1VBT6_9PEZI